MVKIYSEEELDELQDKNARMIPSLRWALEEFGIEYKYLGRECQFDRYELQKQGKVTSGLWKNPGEIVVTPLLASDAGTLYELTKFDPRIQREEDKELIDTIYFIEGCVQCGCAGCYGFLQEHWQKYQEAIK